MHVGTVHHAHHELISSDQIVQLDALPQERTYPSWIRGVDLAEPYTKGSRFLPTPHRRLSLAGTTTAGAPQSGGCAPQARLLEIFEGGVLGKDQLI